MSFLLSLNVFSSTKLEKRVEEVLLEVRGLGQGIGGRGGPNNMCTYE
jgi:hypothetical protein